MKGALKHWREAATVILVAGTKQRAADNVLQRRGGGDHDHDYRVLLLKRSEASGFMPSAYVFPGGVLDASDFSSAWLDVLAPFRGARGKFGLPAVRQPPDTRPPIFATDRSRGLGSSSSVPGEVALRICAVRETFEESGVLLVVPAKRASVDDDDDAGPRERARRPASLAEAAPQPQWDAQVLARWRSLVIEDARNFIRMCEQLQCVPNIWALHEWGNWLTPANPTGSGRRRRYDTAFFMCCLQETPHAAQDQKEIVHLKWSSPIEILHSFQAKEMWIAVPQFYELSRMCRLSLLEQLHSFAQERALEGCERWLPVRLFTPDNYVMLLPGDSLYQENLDKREPGSVNMLTDRSIEELQTDRAALHRIVFRDLFSPTVHINITPKYKHLVPLFNSAPPRPTKHSSHL
ncbi:acyl-coenzyme A diphosphatase NUDT19 [Scleropages formosus]|uniref:Acyl-coenzyme A diphosphatase NUDT19 n=1 Tax=Scleropages formosus TaxID=113540 RepID=A0A8C9SRD7_SCLFO|nr:nucleoside diphosphate-linked moiety X motif 19 [Scleropages formosus]